MNILRGRLPYMWLNRTALFPAFILLKIAQIPLAFSQSLLSTGNGRFLRFAMHFICCKAV